jgi:hypothetical protein
MLKRIIIAALMLPLVALAQSYPSPTFNNVTVQGTLTAATPAFTNPVPVTSGGTGAATASGARTNLGLGTAATANTGTSGATVPLLNAANTWALGQTFSVRPTFNGATPWDSANLNFATPPAIGSTTPAAGAFTTLSATEPSNGLNTLQVTNTGSQGANIHMTGNGSTTPTKYLRVVNGSFGIANDANSALALALTDAGNLSVLGSIQPSQTGGIIGTNTNNNANAGSVGESGTVQTGPTSAASLTITNAASQTLQPGDWEVWGDVHFTYSGTTSVSSIIAGLSTTSATVSGIGTAYQWQWAMTAGNQDMPAPRQIFKLAVATQIFLVCQTTYSGGTSAVTGTLRWRRMR